MARPLASGTDVLCQASIPPSQSRWPCLVGTGKSVFLQATHLLGDVQMSHQMLSATRPRALAVAVTLACLAPAAMAAGRQDLHTANLAQLQARYSSLVAGNGVPAMAHTRHEQLIGADADTRLVLVSRNTD